MKYQLCRFSTLFSRCLHLECVARHYENYLHVCFRLPQINNACGFQLVNRFCTARIFKFFISKDTKLEPMDLPLFPSFSFQLPVNKEQTYIKLQKQLSGKMCCEKRVLKNFGKFKGKHLYWRLFLINL